MGDIKPHLAQISYVMLLLISFETITSSKQISMATLVVYILPKYILEFVAMQDSGKIKCRHGIKGPKGETVRRARARAP